MKFLLRPFSAFMKVGVSFLIFTFLPNAPLNSCFSPLIERRELYYFSLFLDDISDMGSLSQFTNHIWNISEREMVDSLQFPKFYLNNIAEWQDEIMHKATDEDIFKVLYKTEPEDYFKNENELKSTNSFIKTIAKDDELLPYLQFAKKCEHHMANMQWDWSDKSDKMVSNANTAEMRKLVAEGKKRTEISKNPFVKFRTAYLTMKLQHYLEDNVAVKQSYEKYFKNATSKSWIFGSARYYYALTFDEGAQRNTLLIQTFDNSIDKRETCMNLFALDSINGILPSITSKQDRAALMTMKVIKSEGPSLTDLKYVYDNNPQSQDLALLVHREVSKLEDWILTPEVTDYNNYDDHFFIKRKDVNGEIIENDMDDPWYVYVVRENETKEAFEQRIEQYHTLNKQKDVNYCDQVIKFVQKVVSEKKQEQYEPLMLSAMSHLYFIKQDWTNFELTNDKIEKLKKANKYIKDQVKLLKFLAQVKIAQNLNTPSVESALMSYFNQLKSDKDSPSRSEFIKDQVAMYCAKEYIKKGEVAKGILLLSKTNRLLGDYVGYLTKNIYHKLLELAEPKDYDNLLAMINKKQKTPFEAFLTSDPKPYEGNNDYYYDEKAEEYKKIIRPREWDISKIKEYKSMYYLRHNDVNAAYNVVKDIPDSYWESSIFKEFMNVNTFYVDVRNPHQHVKEDSTHYNKKQILKQIVDLKTQLDSDPIKYADNNLSLGNAYYNMSNRGNSWLMWDVYWSASSDSELLNQPLSIAEKYYADGLKNCKNVQTAAVCFYMANLCRNEDWTEFESAKNIYAPIFKKRFPISGKYTTLKFWCSN